MKYSETQTEAQEIGWDPRPLVSMASSHSGIRERSSNSMAPRGQWWPTGQVGEAVSPGFEFWVILPKPWSAPSLADFFLILPSPFQINPDRQDKRLNHFKVYRDITLYKAKLWSLGEDNYTK